MKEVSPKGNTLVLPAPWVEKPMLWDPCTMRQHYRVEINRASTSFKSELTDLVSTRGYHWSFDSIQPDVLILVTLHLGSSEKWHKKNPKGMEVNHMLKFSFHTWKHSKCTSSGFWSNPVASLIFESYKSSPYCACTTDLRCYNSCQTSSQLYE